jgi:putative membrane protein
MKKIATVVALLIAATATPALGADDPQSGAKSVKATTAADTEFVQKAAYGGIAEVKLGKLAQEKASSEEVKRFAERMMTDHTKANDELKALATKKGIDVPSDMDAEHQAKMEKLEKLSGAEFDQAYMTEMIAGHEKMETLLEQQAKRGKDEDLQQYADKTLPSVREHHRMAEEIHQKLGSTGGGSVETQRTSAR